MMKSVMLHCKQADMRLVHSPNMQIDSLNQAPLLLPLLHLPSIASTWLPYSILFSQLHTQTHAWFNKYRCSMLCGVL
jgi:hypothetical protein